MYVWNKIDITVHIAYVLVFHLLVTVPSLKQKHCLKISTKMIKMDNTKIDRGVGKQNTSSAIANK